MVAKSLGGALALSLVLSSPAAFAVGLGDMRLLSPLNATLNAEIELVGATPEELGTLNARVASRETFARYGLEWPNFLSSVTTTTERTADGRDIIRVRSAQSLTEPFLTLLIEVDWARGRLVREYTALLDPPVYTPGENTGASSVVAAPAAGTGVREGAIARPQSESAPAPAPVESPSSVSSSAGMSSSSSGDTLPGGDRTVRRGETLSEIASELSSDSSGQARSWMLAIYQANPSAFDGNMNILRSGAVLRIPDSATVAAVAPSEAAVEIRRQYAAWRSDTPSTASPQAEPGRLRLVTPSDSAGAGGDSQALQGRVRELEAQLDESRRLLELRNSELAQLQARLSGQPAAAQDPVPPAEEAPAPVAETSPAAEQTPPVADATATDPAVTEEPAAAATEPVPAEPAKRPRRPVAAAEETVEGNSLIDTLKSLWWVIALAVVAIAGLLGLRAWRARQQSEFDDSLGRLAAASAGADTFGGGGFGDDQPSFRETPTVADEDAFRVEESGSYQRPRFEGAPAPATRNVSTDTTISSETAINLDQGDPLAEADFHMAYGLYDQAADLVRIAIQREPDRRDLRLKLLEVFFVWGNRDQFLQTAHELAQTREDAAPGEWEKIVIMGKQLAPDDPMFASGGFSNAAAGGVDLDLEGGHNRVDFDLLGEPMSEQGVDLDFGSALGDATAENPTARGNTFALHDSDDGEASSATTRQMTQKMSSRDPAPLLPDYGLDSLEAPTVEQPALHTQDNPTIRQKVAMALKQNPGDQTAELALDDLGLDLDALDSLDQPQAEDAPTMVAGLDERSRRVMEEAERRGQTEDQPLMSATGSWRMDGNGETDFDNDQDGSATSRMGALKGRGLDYDLGGNEDALAGLGRGNGVDLDVGAATVTENSFAATQRISPEDLALPDLEPVTMSEVGTKLDLARAYMDMGDPEGARNILEEVLGEGSVVQKQEAQRLLESLPG